MLLWTASKRFPERPLSRVEENIGAASLELSASDLNENTEALSKVLLRGDWHPEAS
jgi:hypothetical protein